MSAVRVEAKDERLVKQWLAQHPKRAVTLSLTTKDSERCIVELATWPCSEVAPNRAGELIDAVDGYARASDADCKASVVWADKDGKVLQTRLLNRKCPETRVEAMDSLAVALDGSPMAQAAQAQKQLEKMTRLYYDGLGGMMSQMKDLAKTAIDMARDVMDRSSRDRELIEELREQLQEIVVTQAEAAADSAEAAAVQRDEDKAPNPVELAVGMGMQMLMANTQSTPKPGSSNGAPSA